MVLFVIEVLVSLALIALFCIFMDALTLVVEFAWVLPIIVGVYLLARLIFVGRSGALHCNLTPDLSESSAKLKALVEDAAVDGVISEREKRDLIARGAELGLSPMESESIVLAKIQELQQKTN